MRLRSVGIVTFLLGSVAGPLAAQRPTLVEVQRVLQPLVESYGPSGMEGPVRERVRALLPACARCQHGL